MATGDGQLFDGTSQRTFRRLADFPESDDIDDDEGSDFESEPLDSSSSDMEEEDEDYYDRQFAHDVRGDLSSRRGRREHSESEESVVSKDVPDWFQDKPFQYNGRMAILAIPGSLLVLLFSGDTMLGIVVIGLLIIYLLHNSGNSERAITAYIATFVVIQLTVIYSVLSLVWKSAFNIIIVLALNSYSLLTGGWIMLAIEPLRLQDYDLMMMIEAGLFSFYPAVFVIVVTWSVAVMTTITVAPYVFMILGFVVLQVFLAPTTSSFIKPHAQGNIAVWDLPHGYILTCQTTALITLLYTLTCPSLIVALKLLSGTSTVFSYSTVVQAVFVATVSVFLSTFLHLRLALDRYDIPVKILVITRWSTALLSLVLASPFLASINIHSTLLPWMPLFIILYACLLLAILRRIRLAVCTLLASLAVAGVGIFYMLPWQLDHRVAVGLSVSSVQWLLLVNLILCLLTIYSALYMSNELFGTCFIIQSACFAIDIRLLLLSDLTSVFVVGISTVLHSYSIHRLLHGGKLPWQHGVILLAVHWTLLCLSADSLYPEFSASSSGLVKIYDFIATWILVYNLIRLMSLERKEAMNIHEVCRHVLVIIFSCLLNVPLFLSRILYVLTGSTEPPLTAYLGLTLLIGGIVYAKLACFNGIQSSATAIDKHFVPASLILPLSLLIVRPQLAMDSEDLQRWSAVICLCCITFILPLSSLYRKSLHIIGSLVGLPLAFSLVYLMFPSRLSLLLYVSAGILATLCVVVVLVAWQQPKHTDRWIRDLSAGVWMSSLVCCVLELLTETEFSAAFVSSFLALLTTSFIVHHRCSTAAQENLDPTERPQSNLALIGNVCTVSSLVCLALACPTQLSYLWICAGSSVLLLLNKDNLLLAKLSSTNRFAPVEVAVTLTLYSSVLLNCSLWQVSAGGVLVSVLGLLELLALIATLPIVFNLWTICWSEEYWWSDRAVVFLAPVYLLFLYVGETYASWCLTAYGLLVSGWLIMYKLPLEVNDHS